MRECSCGRMQSLSVCLSVCLSICLSICLSVCPSVCPSVCLSVCLSVHSLLQVAQTPLKLSQTFSLTHSLQPARLAFDMRATPSVRDPPPQRLSRHSTSTCLALALALGFVFLLAPAFRALSVVPTHGRAAQIINYSHKNLSA